MECVLERGLISIGNFSRASQLTVKALRLYDEQGILRPGYTDPQSGYRYYSSAQLGEARLIRMLRSLEMSLEDIRAFLREKDPLAREELLVRHRRKMERKLEDYRSIISSIEHLTGGKGETMAAVEIKEFPEQNAITVRFKTSIKNIGMDLGKSYASVFTHIGKVGGQPVGPPFAVYHDQEFKEDDVDVEAGAPVAGPLPGGEGVNSTVLPGGTFASTLHAGSYESIGEAYERIMAWISENGYRPSGPCRELYLTDPNAVKDPADNRTEILFPVEKA